MSASQQHVTRRCRMQCPHAVQIVLNSFYVTLWITLSGTVILYNKWILAYYGFPYPISLTMWHMAFSAILAFLCVRLGFVPAVNMTTDTYLRAIVPIGALFAGAPPLTNILICCQISKIRFSQYTWQGIESQAPISKVAVSSL